MNRRSRSAATTVMDEESSSSSSDDEPIILPKKYRGRTPPTPSPSLPRLTPSRSQSLERGRKKTRSSKQK